MQGRRGAAVWEYLDLWDWDGTLERTTTRSMLRCGRTQAAKRADTAITTADAKGASKGGRSTRG